MRGICTRLRAHAIVVIALGALVSAASPAFAARVKKVAFSIEVGPPGWRADALTAALRADLADDQLLLAAPGVAPELTIRADVRGDELRFVIVHWGVPTRGRIALAGLDRHALAGAMRDRLHRLVRPHDEAIPGAPADVPAPAGGGLALVALGLLALLLAAPLVVAWRVLPATWLQLRLVRGTLLGLAGVAVAAVAIVALGERIPDASALVLASGGLAWGVFAAALLPIATPSLVGLHRIEHDELGPVLRTWTLLAVQRTLGLAVVLVALGAVLWLVGRGLGLPTVITFAVIAPIVGLTLRHVRRALVEILAARLDAVLVDGDATLAQPWHAQVRAYFVGYLRRANLEVDGAQLDTMRFLPGTSTELEIYGGGLTHTRVVIGRAVLELALAPYGRPHDYPMPRVSTLHWTHWNAGLVMPTEAGDTLATTADRQPSATVEEGEHERIALGEPPTLTGIIEPVALDPRTHYRPDEDPLWLDWDPGEEFDGTDAGDKDFLFGALVHARGMIERHEDRGATFALAWRQWLAPRAAARRLARVTAPMRRIAARQTDALADTHAALGGAGHHLAQYLAWRLWRRDDLTTPRAFVPVLERTSRAIYAALDADADVDDVDRAWRSRLAGLRMFTTGAPPRRSQRQRLAVAFAIVAAVATVAVLVIQSVLYHPAYEQRMTEQSRTDPRATPPERPRDGNRP